MLRMRQLSKVVDDRDWLYMRVKSFLLVYSSASPLFGELSLLSSLPPLVRLACGGAGLEHSV